MLHRCQGTEKINFSLTERTLLVQMNIFGPAALPLLQANAHVPGLPHSLLADWEQYGISLGAAAPRACGLVSTLQYRVLDRTAGAEDSKRVLQVFLFLEHRGSCGHVVIGENSHWARELAVTHALRKELLSVLTLHSAKFHRAVHSALNKVLHNHTTQAEVNIPLEENFCICGLK